MCNINERNRSHIWYTQLYSFHFILFFHFWHKWEHICISYVKNLLNIFWTNSSDWLMPLHVLLYINFITLNGTTKCAKLRNISHTFNNCLSFNLCIYIHTCIYVSYNTKITISSCFNYTWRIDSALWKMRIRTHKHEKHTDYLTYFFYSTIICIFRIEYLFFVAHCALDNQFSIKFIEHIQSKHLKYS